MAATHLCGSPGMDMMPGVGIRQERDGHDGHDGHRGRDGHDGSRTRGLSVGLRLGD